MKNRLLLLWSCAALFPRQERPQCSSIAHGHILLRSKTNDWTSPDAQWKSLFFFPTTSFFPSLFSCSAREQLQNRIHSSSNKGEEVLRTCTRPSPATHYVVAFIYIYIYIRPRFGHWWMKDNFRSYVQQRYESSQRSWKEKCLIVRLRDNSAGVCLHTRDVGTVPSCWHQSANYIRRFVFKWTLVFLYKLNQVAFKRRLFKFTNGWSASECVSGSSWSSNSSAHFEADACKRPGRTKKKAIKCIWVSSNITSMLKSSDVSQMGKMPDEERDLSSFYIYSSSSSSRGEEEREERRQKEREGRERGVLRVEYGMALISITHYWYWFINRIEYTWPQHQSRGSVCRRDLRLFTRMLNRFIHLLVIKTRARVTRPLGAGEGLSELRMILMPLPGVIISINYGLLVAAGWMKNASILHSWRSIIVPLWTDKWKFITASFQFWHAPVLPHNRLRFVHVAKSLRRNRVVYGIHQQYDHYRLFETNLTHQFPLSFYTFNSMQ